MDIVRGMERLPVLHVKELDKFRCTTHIMAVMYIWLAVCAVAIVLYCVQDVEVQSESLSTTHLSAKARLQHIMARNVEFDFPMVTIATAQDVNREIGIRLLAANAHTNAISTRGNIK